MDSTTIIGIAASSFTAASMLPQLFKVIKARKAGNVSMWMLAVLFAGLLLWIMYGVRKNDVILIAANSFSLLVNGLLFFLALKYKSQNDK